MQHKSFRLNAAINGAIMSTTAGYYIYYCHQNPMDIHLQVAIKSIPLSCLICLNLLYMLSYRANIYSILSMVSLILSLMGDIFLGLNKYNFLIIGGASFLAARIIWGINWSLYNTKLIKYDIVKYIIIHVISFLIYLGIGLSLLIYKTSSFTGFLFGYILIGMPIPMSMAFLRIGKLSHESLYSTSFASAGILLFNVSDILLFIYMILELSEIVRYVSIVIYWVSMFLLTLSLVRTNSEIKEVSTYIEYKSIQNSDSEYLGIN